MSMPAPASSTNDAAICVTANARRRRFVPGVIRTLPLDRPSPFADSAEGRRGTYASSTAADTARITPTHSRRRVHGDVVGADRVARRVARQHGHHRPRDRDRQHRARAAEQQALGQQRATQRARAGAERRADRELAFAAHRPRQNQVRHVGAGDDEHQRRGREQHQQNRPRRRDDLIAEVHRVDAKVRLRLIRLGMGLDDGAVHGAKLRPRRFEIHAGCQPAEQLRHPVDASVHHRRVEMVRARHDVGDDFGLLRIRHRRFEHADDGGGSVAQPDDLADDGRVALETPCVQKRYVSTAAPSALGPSSPALSSRPSTGRRPITSKYEPPTTPARTVRGSPSPSIVNSMVEKSPNALSVLTRACRSRSSGTEKFAFSRPMPFALWRM